MLRPSALLTLSGILYFAAAVPLLFAPEELLAFAGTTRPSTLDTSLLQLLGSALFGFAMLNWMQRHSRIGGIFGRPVVVANLAHTASGALLLGHVLHSSGPLLPLMIALAVYAALAIAFAVKLFVEPPVTG